MAHKVLIVDDDNATCFMLATLLTGAGYEVIAATTLQAAQRALEDEGPDALIVDVRLDGYNGLNLVALNPRPIPVLVMTGFPDAGLKEEARGLGAEYLLKPVEPSTLLNILKQRLAVSESDTSPRTAS
jgi:DNA-binding response OmpR family regulator